MATTSQQAEQLDSRRRLKSNRFASSYQQPDYLNMYCNTRSLPTHTDSEIHKLLHTLSDDVNRLQDQVNQNNKEINFWIEECELLKHRTLQMEKELERGEESRVKYNLLFFWHY